MRSTSDALVRLAPDHRPDDGVCVECIHRPFDNRLPVAQDREAVAYGEDLVEAVRNEEHGHVLRLQAFDDSEQGLDLAGNLFHPAPHLLVLGQNAQVIIAIVNQALGPVS